MSQFLQIMLLLLAIVSNALVIKRNAFDDDNVPTCDNYILNTYLYVLFGFLLMAVVLVSSYENKTIEGYLMMIFGSIVSIVLFILFVIGIFILFYRTDPKDNLVLLHVLWLILIVIFSFMLYIPVKIGKMTGLLQTAIMITLVITVIVAYIGIKHGKTIVLFDWDKYLRFGMFGLVIAYFTLMAFPIKDDKTRDMVYTGLSIFSLTLFILLLLSFNKKLTERAEECHTDNNPNYPKESVGIIIKMINIFQDVLILLVRRKFKIKK